MLSALLLGHAPPALAGPEQDLQALRDYFARRFPDIDVAAFADGAYALDADARAQWQAVEDFPPYELAVSEGETLFATPFANGRRYADCFANGGIAVRQNHPYFDLEAGRVKTLEMAINACRTSHGEVAYAWSSAELAALSAYMAYTSRGQVFDVQVPDDPRALAAYEDGKRQFYSKRGQLNFSCANCHVQAAGLKLRAETLSPALGQPTHFPVYRTQWGEIGTLHRRYAECYVQVRARPHPLQSEAYANLEYFQTVMSNGLVVNGPGARP